MLPLLHIFSGRSSESFCPSNGSFIHVWTEGGLSRCFMDTVVSSLLLLLMVIGVLDVLAFWKKVVEWQQQHRPKPFWYRCQTILHMCMIAIYVSRIIVHVVLGSKPLHGYVELSTCFYVASYMIAILVLYVERTRTLATRSRRGHGIILLLFWSIALIAEILAVVSVSSSLWWFGLKSHVDKVEFGLWIGRCICTVMLFMIGLKAPGLPPKGYDSLNTNPDDIAANQPDDNQTTESSTWASAWKKLKMVWPYVWPKGHYFMQLRVLFCVVLLVAGRVINVFVPVLNKLIIDALTPVAPAVIKFPWRLIVANVGCKLLQGGGFDTDVHPQRNNHTL